MASGNPALRAALARVRGGQHLPAGTGNMTMRGTVVRTLMLGLIALGAAAYPWLQAADSSPAAGALATAGIGIGLIFATLIVVHPPFAPYLSAILASCIGLAIGGVSAAIEQNVGSLVGLSLLAGPIALVVMGYLSLRGVLDVNDRLRLILNTMIIVMFALYAVTLVVAPSGVMPLLLSSPAGLLLSLLVGSAAALNVTQDARALGHVVASGQPKWMEWYGGVSFLVSLVWMYPETVRWLARHYAQWRGGAPS